MRTQFFWRLARLWAFAAIAPAIVYAQVQAPPRDAPRPAPRTGTAVIRGRVVAADGGRPLRRVDLRISAPELESSQGRSTSTDEDGRFEVGDLPAGRYTVTARRSGYLPLQYGQRRPNEQGKPVQVADGEAVDHIDFAMPKMSVISGRVVDETGEPIAGATMLALRAIYFAGRRQLIPFGDGVTQTDEDGEYRITGLLPGTYVVSSRALDKWAVDAATMAYAPTYYPGTTRVGDAKRVTVGVGAEAPAVDIALIPGRAVGISGTAYDSSGRPFKSVSLDVEIHGRGVSSFGGAGSATVGPDGTFAFRDVSPGDYVLVASLFEPVRDVAMLPIVVENADLPNVSLTGSMGGTMTGTVVTAEGATPKIPRVQIAVVEPFLMQPPPSMIAFTDNARATAAQDGTFTLKNVFGPASFAVTVPEGWAVTSIVHGGRDIADQPVDLSKGGEIAGVVVTITDRVTAVSGELRNEQGAPLPDGTVVLFAADAAKWFDASRFVRAVRPDQQGRYQIKGLPPGDYFAAAVDTVEDGEWFDPEYLQALRAKAQPVTLAVDQPRTLTLKLVTR